VTVDGFTDAQLLVLDITDPTAPAQVTATTIDRGEHGYRVSFRPASAEAEHLVCSTTSLAAPHEVWADQPSDLLARSNAADYLVVAPAELLDAAGELAALRERDGLRTMVVDLEDIYDELNHGLASPWAIRDLLAAAAASWLRPPRYVVLAGSGSFDYRDYMGVGDSLVPAPLVASEYGLFPADSLLADLQGDDAVPEMAVGRIPVLTSAELRAYLDKLEHFQPATGSSQRVALVADNNRWGQRHFRSDAEMMASLLPPTARVERIYLPDLAAGTARQLLLGLLRQGLSWLSFVGHSGLDRMTDEGLLLSADVPTLGNQSLPLVTAFTCTLNRFDIPGYASLGEALVWQPDGGAIAVWAPSGLVADNEVGALGTDLFAAMAPNPPRLGDAIQTALATHKAAGGSATVRAQYILLGDPALPLR
jgi:hypothetical protein